MGSENYTVTDSSDSLNQTSGQTITGTGAYTLTDMGQGPRSGLDFRLLRYTLVANDDNASGELSNRKRAATAMVYWQAFNNVANVGASSTPGNMNYSPYGQPFVDPDAIQTYQKIAPNQIAGLRHAAIVQLTVSNQAQIVIIQYYRNQNIIDDVEANQMRADEQVRYQTQFVSIHSYYNSLDQQNRGFFLSCALRSTSVTRRTQSDYAPRG